MDANQALLVLTVLAPFLGAGGVLFLRGRPNPREGASLVAAVATFLFGAAALPAALGGASAELQVAQMLPGLSLAFRGDALGLLFAVLASFLWILTTVYSVGYMRGLQEHAQTRYFACFAIVIGATMGIALAANLFTLFLFYEILTIATYPLVVHKETEEAFQAGRKYLIYTLSGGVAVLAGMALLVGMGGSIDFAHPSLTGISPDYLRAAFLLLFAGFGVKAAIVPLHGWLPSAMIAPTPVSGLLHAVAVVKAGVFGLLRTILFVFGPAQLAGLGLQDFVLIAATITILVGSLLALVQDDFKLRLAYSTISALSYIVLGAALGTPMAILGAVFQIAAHAFAKLTMFFVAGAVAVETGKTKVSELDGLGRRMPRTFVAFGLATLGMAGLPPLAGFAAKWYLGLGAWEAGDWWVLIVLVASSVLNLAYFLPILIRAFFGKAEEAKAGEAPPEARVEEPRRDARATLRWPLLATAFGGVVLGLWTGLPGGPFDLSRLVANAVTGWTVPALTYAGTFGVPIPPVLIFLIGAPIVLALKGRARQIGMIVLAALAVVDVFLLPSGMSWNLPFLNGEIVLLRADGLSLFTGYIFVIITFLAVLYAAVFSKPWLHLYALMYAGTSLGAVFAGDWISLLVFWELMAVTSTLLIWQHGGDAVRSGYRYLLFHGFGGAMLAAGAAMAVLENGNLALGGVTGTWSSFFVLIGIGVNVGFIPLHVWLPDSYPRAHLAASVFLSVYTTKAAVYLLARTTTAATPGIEAVAFMGGIMAVYGVTFAVFQNNMRRLLSYHIVSQVGYMVAGVGMGAWLASDLGTNGGMAHVFNHILYKALLFMTVGVIIWKTGQNDLAKVGGLQKLMPVTAIAFWIAAFSISGVPGFNGFVSKGMVVTAAEEHVAALWILLEIASFGTFLSFLKLGYFAFLRKAPEGAPQGSDPPLLMKAGMIGAAALCVLIGLYPTILYGVLPMSNDYDAYGLLRIGETVVVLGLAALTFFTIGRRVLAPHDTRLRDADSVAYVPAGHGLTVFAARLYGAFGAVFRGAVAAASGLFAVGRGARRIEDRDVNWNLVAYGVALVLVLAFVLWGVSA